MKRVVLIELPTEGGCAGCPYCHYVSNDHWVGWECRNMDSNVYSIVSDQEVRKSGWPPIPKGCSLPLID
jgi:hypothetical protein